MMKKEHDSDRTKLRKIFTGLRGSENVTAVVQGHAVGILVQVPKIELIPVRNLNQSGIGM